MNAKAFSEPAVEFWKSNSDLVCFWCFNMHWKAGGVYASAQLESHSVSNLRVWGSVGAEAQTHAVLNIKIRCEGQENNPPHTAAESQCMQTILCFSGEGRGWESPSEAAAGHWFPSGQGGVTHLLSLCCCSEHPMAQGPALLRTAHVLNFGREGGGEVSLFFCGVPGSCSLQ